MYKISGGNGSGILLQATDLEYTFLGGHLKYRIIPSKVGERIWSNDGRLLLDSRVVEVSSSCNLLVVTLSTLKPFFFNGLNKALPFSDNVGAEAPGIQ